MSDWQPPASWRRITTLDAHTAGEPLRVITGGVPAPPGDTILAKRRWMREHADDLRRALMLEPRGHADMYGCLLTEPVTPDGDVGVLFLHNEGYSTMCGHGIIGLVTVGLQCGLLAPAAPPVVRIDSPAGRITATARMSGDRVPAVSFENVPSFAVQLDVPVQVPGLGEVVLDIGYGGAFYAYVDADALGLALEPAHFARIVHDGMAVKRAVMEQCALHHPDGDADLEFLYGTIFVSRRHAGVHSRNVCVFADGEVDRSPTGTGVSGRAALHHARGELAAGETITIASLIGTTMDVEVVGTTRLGDVDAIVPRVEGSAHLTGRHEFLLDPDDPLVGGVLLR